MIVMEQNLLDDCGPRNVQEQHDCNSLPKIHVSATQFYKRCRFRKIGVKKGFRNVLLKKIERLTLQNELLQEAVDALQKHNTELRKDCNVGVRERVANMRNTLDTLEKCLSTSHFVLRNKCLLSNDKGEHSSMVNESNSSVLIANDMALPSLHVGKTLTQEQADEIQKSFDQIKNKADSASHENSTLRQQIDDLIFISKRKDNDIFNLLDKFLLMKRGKENFEYELICRDLMHGRKFQKLIEQLNDANADINFLTDQLRGKEHPEHMKYIIKLLKSKIALQEENSSHVKKANVATSKTDSIKSLPRSISDTNLILQKDVRDYYHLNWSLPQSKSLSSASTQSLLSDNSWGPFLLPPDQKPIHKIPYVSNSEESTDANVSNECRIVLEPSECIGQNNKMVDSVIKSGLATKIMSNNENHIKSILHVKEKNIQNKRLVASGSISQNRQRLSRREKKSVAVQKETSNKGCFSWSWHILGVTK